MRLYEIPRVERFNGRSLVSRTNSIVRPIRRFHSWFRGWRDGRSGLNGESSSPDFRDSCNFLRKIRSHADGIGADCTSIIVARAHALEETLGKLRERFAQMTVHAQELNADAAGLKCERPTSRPASYHRLLVFLFVAELAFSYLNLMYSDMGGFTVEAVLSLVFAGCLVGLSDLIGKRYRRLPLALSEPKAATVKMYLEIAFFSLCLVGVLVALTYLRARGIRARGEAGASEILVEVALFVIGYGFLAYAGWIAGQTEYSGPKFGLAALERQMVEVADLIKAVESELKGIEAFKDTLSNLLTKNKDRIAYIYVDQYKRHEGRSK